MGRLICVAGAVLALAGCAKTVYVSDGDLYFDPIRPTASDIMCISDRLVDQLDRHNETGATLYGWEP